MLGWLPNLLLWGGVACLLIGRWRSERAPGMLAGFSGIAALLCGTVWIQGFILLTGYYVWMASMALLAVAGFCRAATSMHCTKTRRSCPVSPVNERPVRIDSNPRVTAESP
jgi:hypothetical protein